MDEYVPTMIPTNKANEKLLNTSPPNTNSISTTINVVKDVITVLFSVVLMDKLKVSIAFS